MPLKYINEKEFDELTKGDKPVIVNFTASWCGPCKMIAPKVETLATENPGVIIVKVDLDTNQDLAEKCNVSAVPTFILYVHGKKAGEVVGANYDAVKNLIAKA